MPGRDSPGMRYYTWIGCEDVEGSEDLCWNGIGEISYKQKTNQGRVGTLVLLSSFSLEHTSNVSSGFDHEA